MMNLIKLTLKANLVWVTLVKLFQIAAFLFCLYDICLSKKLSFFFLCHWVNTGASFVTFPLCLLRHSLDRHGTVRMRMMKTNEDEAAPYCTSTP